MIFINNRYTIIYYSIIKTAAQHQSNTVGKERHHIIPESFFKNRKRAGPVGWLPGNPNNISNLVFLTPREHAFCHKLLVRMTAGKMKSKMVLAIWRMMNGKNHKLFSSRDYEKYRVLFSESIKIINSGKKRKPLTEEHKETLSLLSLGVPKSEKTKNNMKLAWKSRDRTVKDSTKELNRIGSTNYWSSDSARKSQSEKRKDFLKTNPTVLDKQIKTLNKLVQCECCGKVMNIGNYKKWHDNKCHK